MTIEELTKKTSLLKNKKLKKAAADDILIEQLKILADENSGTLPSEFILSDNKQSYITFESILDLLKSLGLKIDNISSSIPAKNKKIHKTNYVEKYNKLYHVKIHTKE